VYCAATTSIQHNRSRLLGFPSHLFQTLVHFAKKSLPPDVLLQEKFRMRCCRFLIVLALQ